VFYFVEGSSEEQGKGDPYISSCRSVVVVKILRSSLQAWARGEFHRNSSLLIVGVLLVGGRFI
jgi:hypothetical protein